MEKPAFIMTIANAIWAEQTDRCLESLDADCWSAMAAKMLGVLIILGSCMNRAPIIRNILDNKSATGLSRAAIYGDALVCANATFFGALQHHPVTAWGENGALLIQSLVIVAMMFHFDDPNVSARERVLVGTAVVAYLVAVLFLLPEDYRDVLVTFNLPVLLYSRGSQVLETYRLQHSGAQSITTTSMNLMGGIIRIFTSFKEIGWAKGKWVLIGFFVGVSLNFIMAVQHWLYWSNTEQFRMELKKKKQS